MDSLQEAPVNPGMAARAGWKANPVIYEINAWVWLNRLSAEYDRPITLANLPERELEALACWQFDALWLMGVWHRGRATRLSALNYLHEYRGALPDITEPMCLAPLSPSAIIGWKTAWAGAMAWRVSASDCASAASS